LETENIKYKIREINIYHVIRRIPSVFLASCTYGYFFIIFEVSRSNGKCLRNGLRAVRVVVVRVPQSNGRINCVRTIIIIIIITIIVRSSRRPQIVHSAERVSTQQKYILIAFRGGYVQLI